MCYCCWDRGWWTVPTRNLFIWGEKVALTMLQRYCWWRGMARSVTWYIIRCRTCHPRKSARSTIRWPLGSLPLPSRPGTDGVIWFVGAFARNEEWHVYLVRFFVVDFFWLTRRRICVDEGWEASPGLCFKHRWLPGIYQDGGVRTPFSQIEAQSLHPQVSRALHETLGTV